MPPAPPDAEFDARFNSGHIVRTVDPEGGVVDLSIDVNEATYPVTLSWTINPENSISYSFNGRGVGKARSSGVLASGTGSLQLSNGGRVQLSGQSQRMGLPQTFTLHQNYPNPFNPSTQIKFDLPTPGNVLLKVYDVLGREVTTLVEGFHEAGHHAAMWDAAGHASGVYFVRFTATDPSGTVRMNKMAKLLLAR